MLHPFLYHMFTFFFHLLPIFSLFLFFFFNDTATTEIYTLSLHDALPICLLPRPPGGPRRPQDHLPGGRSRSEEHTSELQSRGHLVCRLLLEKKKKQKINKNTNHIKHHNLTYRLKFMPTHLHT